MDALKTQTLEPDAQGRTRAVAIWKSGGLVAFPTETVYGLGADATNGLAVARIYEAKGRPAFNPLIIHVADIATARRFAQFNDMAENLAAAFWPGPLSLVLPVKPGAGLSELVTAGLETVAVRVPANPIAQQLLAEFGGAIAAPSANPSGRISPTRAEHVLAGLSGRIEAVVDGGACQVGLESTIVLPDDTAPALLRAGGLPREAIEEMLGRGLISSENPDAPTSPGQLTAHYAPRHSVILNAKTRPAGACWLGFGPDCAEADLNLSVSGDLREAAANLFAHLHQLDRDDKPIAVAPVPKSGLGAAINDRLKRAASDKA
jgi:L-threonylcarbamoyladenylate synthase